MGDKGMVLLSLISRYDKGIVLLSHECPKKAKRYRCSAEFLLAPSVSHPFYYFTVIIAQWIGYVNYDCKKCLAKTVPTCDPVNAVTGAEQSVYRILRYAQDDKEWGRIATGAERPRDDMGFRQIVASVGNAAPGVPPKPHSPVGTGLLLRCPKFLARYSLTKF